MEPQDEIILIIDDEEIITDVLSEYLGGKGYRILSAWTGKEGLDILKKVSVDLVILDKNLPDMPWDAVLKGIWEINHQTRVIIVTAYPSKDSIIKAFNLGVSHYLEKPFDLKKIDQVIEKTITYYHLRQKLGEHSQALRDSADRLKEIGAPPDSKNGKNKRTDD